MTMTRTFLMTNLSLNKENTSMFLNGVLEGWGPEPSCCSAQSKEYLECMSWVGRRSATKFVQRVEQKWDRVVNKTIEYCLYRRCV